MQATDAKQPGTWRPAPYAARHGDKTALRWMEEAGAPADLVGLADELLGVWAAHLPGNRLKRRYYHGENVLKDLGIAIPPPLRSVETVVGWPKKAVSAMASRSRFDGFTSTDEDAQAQLDELVARTNLKRKYKQACESELIAGCDFVTLSKGEGAEPPVIVVTHSAEDGAAVWDERMGRIAAGMVVMRYSEGGAPSEMAIYTDEATYHVAEGVFERMPHRMGRPMMEAMAYNPTESRPFGQSRITRAVRSLTDSAVREALRTEISAEFFTSPQKYLLGVDGDPFESKTRWEAYIGNIFTVGQREDGGTPSFGQLSQGSMQPHTDYMRSLAARFSGETNVPVSQLGVIHDNPSSAEAITQANEPLIMEVTDLNEGNNDSLVAVAKMALAVMDGRPLSDYESLDVVANFRNPLMPSLASQADAAVKLAGAVPEFAGTEMFWELVGFTEDQRKKVLQQMQANASSAALMAIMGGQAVE